MNDETVVSDELGISSRECARRLSRSLYAADSAEKCSSCGEALGAGHDPDDPCPVCAATRDAIEAVSKQADK